MPLPTTDTIIASKLTQPTYMVSSMVTSAAAPWTSARAIAPSAPEPSVVSVEGGSSTRAVAPSAPDAPPSEGVTSGNYVSAGKVVSVGKSKIAAAGGGSAPLPPPPPPGAPGGETGCPTLASPCTNPLTGQPACCCPQGYVADQAKWACVPKGAGGGGSGGGAVTPAGNAAMIAGAAALAFLLLR